jgi:hypothetical protein
MGNPVRAGWFAWDRNLDLVAVTEECGKEREKGTWGFYLE